ncbi:MAG: hypothetical protein ACP5SG_05410 [Dissulfurimicrobium sp.]|uniref:VgrG-related protein n=1 Tax=Dissulfurimicrobium TaxID=1769732 RepID=UPI003C749190
MMSIAPIRFKTPIAIGTASQNRYHMQLNGFGAVNSFNAALASAKENAMPNDHTATMQAGKNFHAEDAASTNAPPNAPAESMSDNLAKVMAALEQERFLAFLLTRLSQVPTAQDQGAVMDIAEAPQVISFQTQAIHVPAAHDTAASSIHGDTLEDTGHGEIGRLSAEFESGNQGPGTIGYDETGGTSYGTYQISSRRGTFNRFISFLEKYAPDYAARLKAAGNPDTGGKSGKVPQEWQRIAKEDPGGFEALQRQFIKDTHYGPALQKIAQNTGIDLSERSSALKEVLWSTSVQHGPDGAARIFKKAIEGLRAKGDLSDQAIINAVYDIRGRQFGSSAQQVQQAITRRFSEEKVAALGILKDNISV